MDWQQLSAMAIVACTAMIMIRGAMRKRNRIHTGCAGGCGCAGLRETPPSDGSRIPEAHDRPGLQLQGQKNILHHR
jgi:hypothetical protein